MVAMAQGIDTAQEIHCTELCLWVIMVEKCMQIITTYKLQRNIVNLLTIWLLTHGFDRWYPIWKCRAGHRLSYVVVVWFPFSFSTIVIHYEKVKRGTLLCHNSIGSIGLIMPKNIFFSEKEHFVLQLLIAIRDLETNQSTPVGLRENKQAFLWIS
jgi:hypothetical protein